MNIVEDIADKVHDYTKYVRLFDVVIKFKDVFVRVASSDKKFDSLREDDEWEQLRLINECLKVFYKLIKIFLGIKFLTYIMFFNWIFQL